MNPDLTDLNKLYVDPNDLIVSNLVIPKFVTPDYSKMKEDAITYGDMHRILFFCLEILKFHVDEREVPEDMKKYFKEVKVGW